MMKIFVIIMSLSMFANFFFLQISNSDLAGVTFGLCCRMCNFAPPLHREAGKPLMSCGEMLWGRK